MKLATLLKVLPFVFVVITAAVFIFMYSSILSERSILREQAEFKSLGLQLRDASDFLTEEARIYAVTGDKKYYDSYMNEINVTKTRDNVVSRLNELGVPQNELDLVSKAKDLSNTLAQLETKAFEAVAAGDLEEATRLMFSSDYMNGKAPIVSTMNDFQRTLEQRCEDAADAARKNSTIAIIVEIAVIALIILTVFLSFRMIVRKVKMVEAMVVIADDISRGNLNVDLSKYEGNDEFGMLARNFNLLIAQISDLLSELETLAYKHKVEGDITATIDVEKYNGAFREVTQNVLDVLENNVSDTMELLECLSSITNGNFDVSLRALPGKKSFANKVVDEFRHNLVGISNEVIEITKAVDAGALENRINASNYMGDWAKMLVGFNNLMDSYNKPINEASQVLQEVSKGHLNAHMVGDYKGDFAIIKNALNATVDSMSSYISEMSEVLAALADNDLDREITREYIGEFAVIKTSINEIITKFNNVIGDIFVAAAQVSSSSRQVSDSSMTLADGASKQSKSVEEMTATITLISDNTALNAKNAEQANEYSGSSKESASDGNNAMEKMLVSMDGIKDASTNISKIIKVIEDIAFQTNLLALNAAVEAARAGEHGKGFAVVADEVRNLASKSQDAAKETTALIEDSMNRVEEGTVIAQTTANALTKIVTDVDKVSEIVENITLSSRQQEETIASVCEGIQHISQVTSITASTSEEAAAAGQELASQAELLNNMLSAFKLRKK